MATFKAVVLKGQKNLKGLSNIKIQIGHRGLTCYLKTDFYIEPELMGLDGKVIGNSVNCKHINAKLKSKTLAFELELLKHDSKYLNKLNVKQIKNLLVGEKLDNVDFFSYAKNRIAEIINEGRLGTASSYSNSVERLKDFTVEEWLPFANIDKKFLDSFVSHHLKADRSINTIGIYLRSIRAIFNDAIDDLNKEGRDPAIINYPFKKFSIEKGETKNRNLDIEIIKRIRDVKLTGIQEVARDICMLIFYFMGVNVKDLFYCKGLINGRFEYVRFKGKKKYSIKVEPEAQLIIDKYKGEKYLLCFADNCREERTGTRPAHTRKEFEYLDQVPFNRMLNVRIKLVAAMEGVNADVDVSTYYFRYAWGNIAHTTCNISMDDVSMAYGHTKRELMVTGIYVRRNLDVIDSNNRKVLDALK